MNNKAFTLAEVLITLTILGVVAAIAVPNLIRNYQDKATITQVKRAYALIDNAIQTAIAEKGPMVTWDWPEPTTAYSCQNANYFADVLKNYLPTKNFCISNECESFRYNIKTLDEGSYIAMHDSSNGTNAISLKNNMRLYIAEVSGVYDMSWDSGIIIDINDTKGPNKFGYDAFGFGLTNNGLDPKKPRRSTKPVSYYCDKNNAISNSGISCAYWILKHNNLDYKYRDVSAEW